MKKDNEMKRKSNQAKDMLFLLAEITKDPRLILKTTSIELMEKLDLYSLNDKVTNDQVNELINMVKQFSQVVDDYKTTHNIVFEEEN